MRGGDVGIGAVVDVEHGRLCALEENFAPRGDLLVDEGDCVRDKRTQALGVALVLREYIFVVERFVGVDGGELPVLIVEVLFELLRELVLLHEVADADADAVVAIHVAGTDAASRRADLVRAALCVADAVHQAVIGHDDMGAVGDADA